MIPTRLSNFEHFNCFETLKPVNCSFCNYATHAKSQISKHKCGFSAVENGAPYKHCDRCKMGSFSTVWRFRHQIKCCLNKTTKEFTNNLKNKVQLLPKWFQCDQCSFKTIIKIDLTIHYNKKHNILSEQTWFQCDYCTFKTRQHTFI